MTLRGVVERLAATFQTQHQDQPGKGRTVRGQQCIGISHADPRACRCHRRSERCVLKPCINRCAELKERERMTR